MDWIMFFKIGIIAFVVALLLAIVVKSLIHKNTKKKKPLKKLTKEQHDYYYSVGVKARQKLIAKLKHKGNGSDT